MSKLHEKIYVMVAEKEASLPECYAEVAVRRRLRQAEKLQRQRTPTWRSCERTGGAGYPAQECGDQSGQYPN
eukprot:3926256-Pyramimonas_sp.AAC.1